MSARADQERVCVRAEDVGSKLHDGSFFSWHPKLKPEKPVPTYSTIRADGNAKYIPGENGAPVRCEGHLGTTIGIFGPENFGGPNKASKIKGYILW